MNEIPSADTPDPKRPPHGSAPPDEAPPEVTGGTVPDMPVERWPDTPPPASPYRRGGYRVIATVLALGVVVLLVALIWLVANPMQNQGEQMAIADLREQVQALNQRLMAVEQKPAPAAPAAPDLAPLAARLTKLEQAAAAPSAKTDLGPLSARVEEVAGKTDALAADTQKAQAALVASMKDTVAALAANVGAAQAALAANLKETSAALAAGLQGAQTTLSGEIGATSQHVQALEDRMQTSLAALSGRLDAEDKRLASVEQASGQVAGLAARTARTDLLRNAATALEAGQPLGDIPGAPPALAHFAHAAPPTEAALRLSFPEAARAAELAQAPVEENNSFMQKIWANVSQAVTIRDGERVLVGGSAAPTLARARHLLEAGDLGGAVSALGSLTGHPAEAMAEWVSQAKSLLAARVALADLTAHG